MNIDHHLPGSVCWVDLGSPDPGASIAFYGSLFGWTFTTPDASGYRLALLGGRAAAGLGPAEDSGDPYWTVNVSTDDITRTLRRPR